MVLVLERVCVCAHEQCMDLVSGGDSKTVENAIVLHAVLCCSS